MIHFLSRCSNTNSPMLHSVEQGTKAKEQGTKAKAVGGVRWVIEACPNNTNIAIKENYVHFLPVLRISRVAST